MFSVKTGLEELKKSKQNFVEKNIRRSRNFAGLDATNELWFESRLSFPFCEKMWFAAYTPILPGV